MHTVVPSLRPVRSRVSPAGTSMLLRVMVEQEVLPDLASAAEVKVQESRALSSTGTAATSAAPTVAAMTED